MLDYVRVINFLLLIIIKVHEYSTYRQYTLNNKNKKKMYNFESHVAGQL